MVKRQNSGRCLKIGTKIFIASLHNYFNCLECKPKRLLESFYYIKKESFMDYVKNNFSSEDFLLDSGAFTFIKQKSKKINFEQYIEQYIEFINKYDIKYFFELDVDVIFGHEKVKEIRKYIEQKTNKKTIPVWHKSRGIEEYIKLSKEYDYIAIGGIVTKEIAKKDYKILNPLIDIAHKNNCRVHGLGFTPMDITKYNFDTSDSTSWKMAGRAGSILKFDGKRIIKIKRPEEYSNKKIKHKVALDFSLQEWNKFIDYVEKRR